MHPLAIERLAPERRRYHAPLTTRQIAAVFARGGSLLDRSWDGLDVQIEHSVDGSPLLATPDVGLWDNPFTEQMRAYHLRAAIAPSKPRRQPCFTIAPILHEVAIATTSPVIICKPEPKAPSPLPIPVKAAPYVGPAVFDYGLILPGSACARFDYSAKAEDILWRYKTVTATFLLPNGSGGTEAYDLTTVRGCWAWGNSMRRFGEYLTDVTGDFRDG